MKKETIIQSVIVIGMLMGLVIFSYWYYPSSDYNCLVEKATNYCIEEGFDGKSDMTGYMAFFCYFQSGDERKGFENTTKKFYFTNQEKDECLEKEKESWRLVKR